MSHAPASEPAGRRGHRYDGTSIALHWITALLVVVLWTIGQTFAFVPDGPVRGDDRSLHIVLGVLLGLLLLGRILWREIGGVTPPPANRGALLYAAKGTYGLLYLLLIAAVVLGVTLAWVRGDQVFGLVQLTSFAPDDKALRHDIRQWHQAVADAILIVAALHAGAGLFHHYVLRDSTLRHILPCFRKDCAHR